MFSAQTKEQKMSRTLFVVCWIVYAIVCMTKNAYSASMVSIIGEGFLTKSLAGTVNASYYVFYGGAQLLLVKLVDKISPVKLINMSLFGALVSMVGFAVADNFYVMLILWSLTGLLQFAIWPAVIRIMSEYLVPEHRGKAMVYIAFAYCTGMLANYGAASLILKLWNWRMIFNIFFVLLVATTLLWIITAKKTMPVLESSVTTTKKSETVQTEKKKTGTWKVLLSSGIVLMLIPSFIRTMMDMGLKSWVPTMITENYGTSPSFASALTTILLLVNLSGIYIVNAVYPRFIKNEAVCFGFCFVLALPFTLVLLLIGKIPVGVAVILLTLVTTLMYSGHQLINVIIPSKFAAMNLSGGVASILNAVASFGAVAATFGYGWLADEFGWTATITVWSIMAAVAAVFAFLSAGLWKRFLNK